MGSASFDYIIIGAGSSGCVLANRLSKNPKSNVLLIEAGSKDYHPFIHIPGGYPKLFRTNVDWAYWSEPQASLDGRKLFLPRGKVLGGSSSINAMAYVRGNKADYDHWSNIGNETWSYDEILPYFKRSERHENIGELDDRFHNDQGELHVSLPKKFTTPYGKAFIEACKALGFNENNDYNGAIQNGTGYFHFNIKDGKRFSGAKAFLKPIMNRGNLTILTKTRVESILVEDKIATGVSVVSSNGTKSSYRAKNEVILSAGSFSSPQILNLSGIGQSQELEAHGIKCKHNLVGVGKNLQDHLFVRMSASSKKNNGLNHCISLMGQTIEFAKYVFGKGALNIGPLESVAFTNLEDDKKPTNFQFHFTPFHLGSGYKADMYDYKTFPTYDGFTVFPSLLQPKSVGYVKLRSSNPTDVPIIQPNFLSEQKDLDDLVKGCKIALDILRQKAFEPYLKEIISPIKGDSDEEIISHIKKSVETIYHPVGTCKMGNDEMAVVSNRLKVHGIENLRVIDASIMPRIIAGNTNAACYMIAEKGAEMIIEDNK